MKKGKINIDLILEGCRNKNRLSQQRLYEYFYGYGMSIALRYSKNKEEAVEILNDSFLKAFNKLDQYDSSFPFKIWFRKILINTAIDYFRVYHKQVDNLSLDAVPQIADIEVPLPSISPNEDLLPIVQQLPPAYRMVFNLYVMEEYKHHEIAELLNISVGTSKSNLSRAKEKLRALLKKTERSVKTN